MAGAFHKAKIWSIPNHFVVFQPAIVLSLNPIERLWVTSEERSALGLVHDLTQLQTSVDQLLPN